MRWLANLLIAITSLLVLAAATLVTAIVFAWPKLPSLEALTDYRPKIPLQVYTSDGYLLGEFGKERRSLVKIGDTPEHLKQAILAAEDDRFYSHHGVDPIGIARAALANFTSGRRGQGASTITMQIARNFFLTNEKTYTRKFFESLLSLKIERHLNKDQIFEIYINQIFLGHRAYGFSAAAQAYFGKPLADITLAEATMLAGIPKGPSIYNPITNLKLATLRQHYILGRMLELGMIDNASYDEAINTPLQIRSLKERQNSPTHTLRSDYVAEMARQIAVEQYGEQAYNLGLRIMTTVTREDQSAAYKALRNGVLEYEKRHGYRGPEKFIDLTDNIENNPELLEELLLDTQDYGELLLAVVVSASPKEVLVYRQGDILRIQGKGLHFAAPMLSAKAAPARRIRRGALIRIRASADNSWEIVQLPNVEAALIAIDANTGAVKALIGGFDFESNKFNHVTQALRQPGSSFKPFIYSAALENGYSPASYESDEPLYFPAGVSGGKAWEPRNYDGRSLGIITVREALFRSRNLVSIRLLQAITPAKAQDYIARFGFEPQRHPPYLTMALGAGVTTPWQLAAAYAIFANGGYKVEPYIIREILDADGNTLARIDPPTAGETAPRVIDPRNAWLMNSMLQDVVRRGTAARAKVLNRKDLAGKTGTTNDYVDAWFAGYTPDVVAVSWIGYDQPRNLGRGETGSRAALPMWIEYMRTALTEVPEKQLSQPQGLATYHGSDGKTDYYYQENQPPMPYYPEMPDFDELRIFMEDFPVNVNPNTVPILPPPASELPHIPAPVEDRSPIPIR